MCVCLLCFVRLFPPKKKTWRRRRAFQFWWQRFTRYCFILKRLRWESILKLYITYSVHTYKPYLLEFGIRAFINISFFSFLFISFVVFVCNVLPSCAYIKSYVLVYSKTYICRFALVICRRWLFMSTLNGRTFCRLTDFIVADKYPYSSKTTANNQPRPSTTITVQRRKKKKP